MAFLLLFSGFVFVFGFISLITICLGVNLFVCPSWGSVSSLDIKILFAQIQGDLGHNFFNFFLPLDSPFPPPLLSFWESYYTYIGMLHVVNRSLGSVNFSSNFFLYSLNLVTSSNLSIILLIMFSAFSYLLLI